MEVARVRIRVTGTVQGVGFRPFVYGRAVELGLVGEVGNDADGVWIEVEGPAAGRNALVAALRADAPPLAEVESVEVTEVAATGSSGFVIAPSTGGAETRVLVSPDVATCDDCRRELWDPDDRRHRYPFTNCTNCGPRYTIVRDVPYDRPLTTMADFPLCEACRGEYTDPTDRRFHAQPVCCPDCGPQLSLVVDGEVLAGHDEALRAAAGRLGAGEVVAVKGLGGYHLAAVAADHDAVATLRARKHREDKPFAVMVADLDAARELCHLDDAATAELTDRTRPIVLLPRRDGAPVADAVAPGNRSLGLLLPYTPLHELLLDSVGAPLVLTSGNVSDEPIAHDDADALERLSSIADAFLTHDRPIHVRVDDSVVRPMGGRMVPVRRSRGRAPAPMSLPVPSSRDVLAVGAELKNTVCLARGDRAFVSQHIGDLENHATLQAFEQAARHVGRLFGVHPEVVAHDLHPEYLSTKFAMDLPGVDLLGVQHHHAHIASCLADNGLDERVVGVAFDGTGYGTDGTVWGGELLVADLRGFDRVGHLAPVAMPGGAAAVREPWRMAAAHLRAADIDPDGLGVVERNAERWGLVLQAADAGINAPLTSSMGRLFDAVAALLDVRDRVTYEGQAAIGLEQLADPHETAALALPVVDDGDQRVLDGGAAVAAAVAQLRAGVDRSTISARFHNAVVAAVADAVHDLAEAHGLGTVALSGGVFQNVLLTTRLAARLEGGGLRVLTHRHVPPNDGGISLGQAAVAAAHSA